MRVSVAFTLAVLMFHVDVAEAAQVVALGASNTFGRGRGAHHDGVPPGQAFPAQLQHMLNASGCHVSVRNAGIPGDTTTGMLHRLPGLLGPDTRVLIIQPGGNDGRRGQEGNVSGNLAAMRAIAAQHKVTVVMMGGNLAAIAGEQNRMPDGQHFNAQGHAAFARYLLGPVRSAGACK